MVFRTTGGDATTPNSQYLRAELREMLRAGDTTIATRNSDGSEEYVALIGGRGYE